VLVADGVGLGKTFIGGELIRQTIEDRRQRALLIAPAALRDGPWERFRVAHSMYMETVSYEQLVADSRLGGGTVVLRQDPNEYALVVVDEAQAFRNPETQRARALRLLLQGKPPKTLVLMTATPVNNSLWDLYYLLTYFVRHDATFSDQGIRSLREKISDTVKLDPDTLSPDALFDILDATTVRRTRHFVQRYYPNDQVTDSRGREIPVVFPKPHVRQIDYSLDDALPGFFEEFEQALAPEKGEPELSLARYSPGRYKTGNHSDDRDEALLGLLRSGLLKRFESSAYAFAKTAETMARAHDVFLDGLEEGVILTAEGIADWEQTDSDEAFEELVRQSGSMRAKGYNQKDLRADVETDRDLLRRFAKRAHELKPQDDPKLKALIEELLKIDTQASKEGFDRPTGATGVK
jgi:SNF2 domain-containing protein